MTNTLETGAEPEEEAWTWLESKWLNIEAGHDPNDRDYSADEMVDAFIAGRDRRLAPAPMTDTLERRGAIRLAVELAVQRARLRPQDSAGQCAEVATETILAALSLPAREVSGERARQALADAAANLGYPLSAEAITRGDIATRINARVALEAIRILSLATTPALREKLEAVIEPARQLLNVALMTTFSDQYPQQCHDLSEALNRLSGEG